MTFEDDFVLLHTESGLRRVTCRSLGIEWPPPEILNIHGFKWVRRNGYSQIPDEARAKMTHVCRGAEYFPEAQAAAS